MLNVVVFSVAMENVSVTATENSRCKKIVAGNTSQWRFDEFKKPCSAELACLYAAGLSLCHLSKLNRCFQVIVVMRYEEKLSVNIEKQMQRQVLIFTTLGL